LRNSGQPIRPYRPKAHHRDLPHPPVSLQPEPDLAFFLFQPGIAIWVNSVWLVAILVAAMTLIHSVVIPGEEQYLERKFGAQYLDNKASVRRWL
jgi:hypothetical protein